MIKLEAFIFDLDGVIVDTAKYHYIAWKKLAEELGFDFTKEDNERLKGVSRMTSLDILLEVGKLDLSLEKKIELAEAKNEHYREYILQMNPDELLPGVMEFLYELKKCNYKLAIGSASKNTPTILERVGLDNFFDTVIDGNKISKAKPDPEVFLKGAEEMNINPENCLVFEDAVAGIEAALKGNMHCIGVGDETKLYKANAVIKDFRGFTLNKLKAIFE